jgi:predicted DNA-binding transcriptional regulator AlpA
MSTTPRPPTIEAAPNTADGPSHTSTQSPNSLIAASIARLRKRRGSGGGGGKPDAGDGPEQLALTFDPPKGPAPRPQRQEKPRTSTAIERFANLDQRMSTTDVLRVVGVNRSTIFRWVKRGIFPQRHASGGWLRSEVEKWLSEKMESGS